MAKFNYFILTLIISIARVLSFSSPIHFGIVRLSSGSKLSPISNLNNDLFNNDETPLLQKSTHLYLNPNDDQSNASSGDATLSLLSESDQTVVGVTGLIMSVVMLYSEYVLKMTGCGLPAGPFGLVGAVEGLSYLGVTGLVAFSLYTKVKTVSKLCDLFRECLCILHESVLMNESSNNL